MAYAASFPPTKASFDIHQSFRGLSLHGETELFPDSSGSSSGSIRAMDSDTIQTNNRRGLGKGKEVEQYESEEGECEDPRTNLDMDFDDLFPLPEPASFDRKDILGYRYLVRVEALESFVRLNSIVDYLSSHLSDQHKLVQRYLSSYGKDVETIELVKRWSDALMTISIARHKNPQYMDELTSQLVACRERLVRFVNFTLETMPSELPPELPFEAEESEGEEDDTLFDRAFYLLEKYLRLANSEEREDWEEVWDLALRLEGAHRELQFLRNLCVEAERDDVELQSLVRDLNVGGDTKEELERAASELGKEKAMRWLLGDYEQRRRQSLVGVVSLWKKAREEEEEERKLYH
ncbi:hypothetical protein BT69DRAFT_1323746 [Atractiella rhizophila]|nr:hypothetical protein BT69DRAFT_1323746 [Atractiella rhizophila]